MENKFRLWDKKMKEMHYFDFNDLCGYEELPEVELMSGENTSGVYLRDGFHLSTSTNDRKGELCPWAEIMQDTGFRDKNGRKIYIGDIVRNEYDKKPNQQIISAKGMFCLDDEDSPLWKYNPESFWEVIGNIYQDNHLLN